MIGHNSDNAKLISIVERIENVKKDIDALKIDMSELFASAKEDGWNPKAIRVIIRERAMDKQDREMMEAELDAYRAAVGLLRDTPLGQASEPKRS